MPPHEDCKHLLGELSNYLDGETETQICAEIESHLAGCENCRVVVDTLRKTVSLYHAQQEGAELPDAVRRRLFLRLDLEDLLAH